MWGGYRDTFANTNRMTYGNNVHSESETHVINSIYIGPDMTVVLTSEVTPQGLVDCIS